MREVKSPASAVTINAINSIFAHICSILGRDVEAEICDSCPQRDRAQVGFLSPHFQSLQSRFHSRAEWATLAPLIKGFHKWWSSNFVPHSQQSNLRDWLWSQNNHGSTTNGKKVPCSRRTSYWQVARTFSWKHPSVYILTCPVELPKGCQEGSQKQKGVTGLGHLRLPRPPPG